MKNLFLFTVLIVLTSMTMCSCDNDDDDISGPGTELISTPSELTTALTEIYEEGNAPGFAISVANVDGMIYQKSFGKADIESNKAYTNQTVQTIGSISKTFVAAAVVKAIEQGYFTLETDINDILPVELKNPKNPNAIIKVKHLVTHTSGLLDQNESYIQAYHILPGEDLSSSGAQLLLNGFDLEQRESTPLDEFLAEYYLEDGDAYSLENFASIVPGAAWNYSNIATSLTAFLVESATEMPFDEYVREYILQPLDMDETSYSIDDLNATNVAKLYWDLDTALPQYGNDSYPDGSIMTSNEDLGKYLVDMMKGVKGESTTLFSTDSYELLFSPFLPNGILPSNEADNHGVFWFLDGEDIKHSGSDPGTTCNLQFDENGNGGYLLMTNMDASTQENATAYFELSGKISEAISEFLQNN
ncbi:MAG: serine hydrolase [Saprospiraceae bacterium]|nr:serine hydrolase [Saprospiraceae bacterium]